MSILNAANGLVAELLDRLADKVARTDKAQETIQSQTAVFLADPARAGGRALVAKMARAEVKDYLAELAEQAEFPFNGAVGFVRDLQNLSPVVTLPDGHTTTCTCHDQVIVKGEN